MPTKTDEKTAPAVEVVVEQETALAPVHGGRLLPTEAPPVAALAMMEDALKIATRMAEVVAGVRRAAITMTDPVDWVLNKDRQGNEVAMLTASGAQKVASLYGISVKPIPPATDLTPERVSINGKLAFKLRFRAHSRFLGREIETEATRREDEEFTGRETDQAGEFSFQGGHTYEPDLSKAVRTLSLKTGVVELVGLKSVSRAELDDCWAAAGKSSKTCRFGHGYGTSNDRAAGKVADATAKTSAEELRIEILKRVSGDESAAKDLLREITANPEKGFKGNSSTAQLTQDWMVERAWKALRKHPTFGDSSAQQPREREPGE